MLQTETSKSRRALCDDYQAKYIVNKEVEWLIEHGNVREAVYFKGATGDRYTIYVAIKRNKNIIDFHSVYNSYGYGTSVGSHIGILRGYIFEMGVSGRSWYSGTGYTFKQLMRQGIMSKKHPWTIRYCRSAHFIKLHDGTEFSPWHGMKIALQSGVLVNKPNRVSVTDYKEAKTTDARIRKANALSNKNNKEALERYRKAGGDTKAARAGWSNGRWVQGVQGAVSTRENGKIDWDMIPMDDIFKHRNGTLRSNILEHYGINAVLKTLEHDVVDIDFIDGREYKLLNVEIPDNSTSDRRSDKCLYLQMVNPSTGEDHFEGVANVGNWNAPKEATVKEALSWRDGDRDMIRTNGVLPEIDSKDIKYIKPITLT
jgi:hypothetical protein